MMKIGGSINVKPKVQVMETWFDRVWSQEDESAIDELFSPDGQAKGLGDQALMGPEDFKTFHRALCALFGQMKIRFAKVVQEGDWISGTFTLTGVQHETGTPIKITGTAVTRIENGVIREAYNHLDFISMFAQLGLLPEDTMMRALSGQKIA